MWISNRRGPPPEREALAEAATEGGELFGRKPTEGDPEVVDAGDGDYQEARTLAVEYDEQGKGQVASGLGKRWTTLESVNRTRADDDVTREVISYAFTLPRPDENGRSVGSVVLADGSSALVAVTRVVMGDISSAPDGYREQLRNAIAQRNLQAEFAAFYRGAEEFVGVTRRVEF